MLNSTEIEAKIRSLKPELAKRYNVSRIGYFGSFAHGSQHMGSDLDVLVEFSKPVGWSFFSLEKFLEESLGVQVDLVTRNGLKPMLEARILKDVRYI